MKFINAIVASIAVGCLSTAALSQSTAVQWTVASGGNGHWYEAVRDQGAICWGYAKLKCEELGGHLATLTSPNEREFVRSQLASGPWYFLGGYQDLSALDFIEPDGGWRWVTGEPWTPLWAEGQPENGGGNQDTVCIYNFGIHDVAQCEEQGGGWRYYVIEWSADCNSDGIVDYGQILSGQLADTNANNIPDCCEFHSSYASAVMASNPSSYWRFEETSGAVLNEVSAGLPGTVCGTISRTSSSATSELGNCYQFSSGAVEIPFSTATQSSSTFTLEVWARSTVELNAPQHIIGIGRDVSPGSTHFWKFNSAVSCGYGGSNNEVSVSWLHPNVTGDWHHYVATFDLPNNFAGFYTDGKLVETSTWPTNPIPTITEPMKIGMHYSHNFYPYYFQGEIDEVAVYQRALTSAEIRGHYCASGFKSGACCPTDINNDSLTDSQDLCILLSSWETTGMESGADIDGDENVDGHDLGMLLGGWGSCVPEGSPPWATVLEWLPNEAVVTDANLRAAITATNLPWRVLDNGTNIEMLLVPGGNFMMGCSASNQSGCDSDENPLHQVTLTNAFYIGKTEVTQAQWTAKMGSNPSHFSGNFDSPSRPVENVSWNMITAAGGFNSATGLRLPTEAEWEFAYRAGTTTAFHNYPSQPTGFNDDTFLNNIAWYSINADDQTHAVGGKLANALGLHDMSGNVWEFCHDWHGAYSSDNVTNPTGPTTGTFRMLRGGNWSNQFGAKFCRASQRGLFTPDFIYNGAGFRAARNP